MRLPTAFHCSRLDKVPLGDVDYFAALRHGDAFIALLRFQVKRRWSIDFIPLRRLHLNAVRAEIAVLDEIGCQTAVAAARGCVFWNAKHRRKHANAEILMAHPNPGKAPGVWLSHT